jgi:hypothetical protein
MSTPAQERRHQAIQAIVDRWMPASNGYELTSSATREAVAESIGELARLGRTERWLTKIAEWAEAVEGAENERALAHRLLQGTLYAVGAA